MHYQFSTQLQSLMCGVLLILIVLAFALLIYCLGKNYLDKRNSYYKDLYQKSVDKALKKKERRDK